RPEPRSIRISVSVDAANAPATIAPQLTADGDDSVEAIVSVADWVVAMASSYRMNRASRMMIGMGTPNSQSRMPRPMMISFRMIFAEEKATGVAGWLRVQAAFANSLADAS